MYKVIKVLITVLYSTLAIADNTNVINLDQKLKDYALEEYNLLINDTEEINNFLKLLKKNEIEKLLETLDIPIELLEGRTTTNEWG